MISYGQFREDYYGIAREGILWLLYDRERKMEEQSAELKVLRALANQYCKEKLDSERL